MPRNNFDEILISLFFSSLDIELRIFGLLAKLLQEKCQNCILSFQRSFLRKTSSLKIVFFFYLFSIFEPQNITLLSFIFAAGFSKLHSKCPKGFFEKKYLFWRNLICFLFHFRTSNEKASIYCRNIDCQWMSWRNRIMSKNLLAFWRKLFNRVFKTASYWSKDIIWGKILFKENGSFLNVLWHWAKNFRSFWNNFILQDCQNCKLRVHWNLLWKTFGKITILSVLLRPWGKSFGMLHNFFWLICQKCNLSFHTINLRKKFFLR